MRFLYLFVFALLGIGCINGGSAASKEHEHEHSILFSKTAPSELVLQNMFASFIKHYSKKYSVNEFSSRFETFKRNIDRIRTHNTQRKSNSYTMGLNEFADLSSAEFQSKYFGYRHVENEALRSMNYHHTDRSTQPPAAIDWRDFKAVTPVKNQGSCGSCWAFSTTGSTEGAWVLQGNHSLVSLSEQQLVDCSFTYGNHGCDGGLMDYAFAFAKQNGLCSEDDYPYTATDGVCQTVCKEVLHISGWKDIPTEDENALYDAVGTIGPVSVAVEADKDGFQFYSKGVYSGDCGTALNHGVLAVGYGTDNGQDYWIVKNSWGNQWGESGYIRLIRGHNECGISNAASYPIL